MTYCANRQHGTANESHDPKLEHSRGHCESTSTIYVHIMHDVLTAEACGLRMSQSIRREGRPALGFPSTVMVSDSTALIGGI